MPISHPLFLLFLWSKWKAGLKHFRISMSHFRSMSALLSGASGSLGGPLPSSWFPALCLAHLARGAHGTVQPFICNSLFPMSNWTGKTRWHSFLYPLHLAHNCGSVNNWKDLIIAASGKWWDKSGSLFPCRCACKWVPERPREPSQILPNPSF